MISVLHDDTVEFTLIWDTDHPDYQTIKDAFLAVAPP